METSVSALSENGGGDQNDDDDQKELDDQEHQSQLSEKMIMMMMINVIMIPDSCMQSPTDSSCTGEDIGGTDSLPDKVNIMLKNRNIFPSRNWNVMTSS